MGKGRADDDSHFPFSVKAHLFLHVLRVGIATVLLLAYRGYFLVNRSLMDIQGRRPS